MKMNKRPFSLPQHMVFDYIMRTLIYKDSIQMSSFTQGILMQHKQSKFSSSASHKIYEKPHQQQQAHNPQPLEYHDIIYLVYPDHFALGLADVSQLSPGLIDLNQSKKYVFGMMEILPVGLPKSDNTIRAGQKFYLKNYQSDLYLCGQEEPLQKFTNIIFKQECNSHCEFTFERNADASDKIIYNRETLRIRSAASNLYIHIQQESQDHGRYKHLWLTQSSDEFKVIILNKHKSYPQFLNNNDIILLSAQIKCQKRYIGVTKHKNLYEYTQRKDSVAFDVNTFYYQKDNCQIEFYKLQDGRKRFFSRCLWRVIKYNLNSDFTFLVKNKEEIYLQHLETGLYLYVDSNNHLVLQNNKSIIKIQNQQKFKTQFSNKNKFQPVCIKHSVILIMTSPIAERNYSMERISCKNYVTLYFSQIITFFDNLIKTMIDPKDLNQNREQLIKQSKLYVFIYRLIQTNINEFEDQGYYYFQYTFKILQVLKIVLKDEKTTYNHSEMAVRRSLLNPLIIQIIKFISFILTINQTFKKITTEDNKKTKEIIHTVFILYDFHFKYTLNLMVTLSSTHPDLVVRLLSEKIYKAEHFQERVQLIQAIYQIIDRFRRINFDEENLKDILQKQHKLIINENCIYISFQRKQHSIFDLFESISKFDNNIDSANKQQKETFYFYYYLLSITKILFNNKTEQLLQSEYHITQFNFNCRHLIKKLSEEYENNLNINARMIILELIYEITSEMYHKEFTTFSKLNFIVYDGMTLLENSTPLSKILKITQENTFEWIFNKEQIINFMEEVLNPQWQKRYELIVKLKYFSKVINFLTATIVTSSYDLETLNLIQQFGIHVSTIFYRKRLNITIFKQIRQEINAYQEKISYLIVDGIKIYLDNLMVKLNIFFEAVLAQKRRLYIYPMYNDRQALFCFDFFRNHYNHLIMNARIRNEIKSIQSLIQLNEQRLQVNGFVLSGNEDYVQGIKMIEKIIQDLDCLAIIMESFSLYGKDKELKENIIAPMKLKILNIQDLLKNVYKNKLFHQCSDAFNLSSHLFQFILENSTEQQLILPLLQSLQQRITYNFNIFTLLEDNIVDFFALLLDPKSIKSSRIVLKWVGKQIENMASPINMKQYQFLYSEIIRLIEDEYILNLINLVNMLKEIGLHHPAKQEILYSKLINLPQIQIFISNCQSLKTFKLAHEKLQKDSQFYYRQYETSLQLITIFRICESYPHLNSHLNNLLPFDDIKEGMDDHQQYFLYKPLLSYLVIQIKNQPSIKNINLAAIFISEHLSYFSTYLGELARYKVRDSLSKDKQGKAHTHFCRTLSMGINNNKNIIEVEEQKRFYWQFLMWVPFYHQSQGLLRNLQQIVMIILDKVNQHENTQLNLEKIKKYLTEIKSLNINFQQHKQFVKKVNNILNLIKIHQKNKDLLRSMKQKKTQIIKTDQLIEQIYKILLENDIMKPFLCKIVRPLIKQSTFGKSDQNIYSSSHHFKRKDSVDILEESQNATLRDKTHHSLINPSESKLQQHNRYVNQELKFNLFQFFKRLKQIIPYKIKLYNKLYRSLLQYFERDGSLVMLQYKLNEQINNHRNRVTQYRQEEDVQYQLYKRVIKSQPKNILPELLNTPNLQFGFEKLDILKCQELIEVNQLKLLALILKETASKSFHQNKVILPDVHQLQNLLLKIMKLVGMKQHNVYHILECCDYLLQIIVKQRNQVKEIDEAYKNELYTSYSFLIYELINTRPIAENANLYLQTFILTGKIQFIFLQNFNPKLQIFILQSIAASMPPTIFHEPRMKITQMQIHMLQTSKRVFNIQEFSFFLELIGKQLPLLIPEDVFSQNMLFYENHKLTISAIDLFQIYLRSTILPKGFLFPSSVIKSLLSLQRLIYQKIYSKKINIQNEYALSLYENRKKLLQSLIIQILTFFSTIHLKKSNQASIRSLYLQRCNYLNQLQYDKEIYEYYQDNFDFCILNNQNKVSIVQAYPKEFDNLAWKPEFHRLLSSYSDLDDKKDLIFSYSILSVEQEKTQFKQENFCHRIQPTVIIISTIIVGLAIIERFIVNNPKNITIWYKLLIIINLVLLLFTIVERIMMIRKVLQTELKIGRAQNWCEFLIKRKKSFISWSIFLIFVNANSIFYPNYISILFFIHYYSRRNLGEHSKSILIYNMKILLSIGLMSLAILFLFTFLIIPDHTPSKLPIFNTETNYDINFMVTFINVWAENFETSSKTYYLLTAVETLKYAFTASIIFYYLHNSFQGSDETKICLLCGDKKDAKIGRQTGFDKDHHIETQHNIFKFISVFKYILKKQESTLSLQEKQLKKMILEKNQVIFT